MPDERAGRGEIESAYIPHPHDYPCEAGRALTAERTGWDRPCRRMGHVLIVVSDEIELPEGFEIDPEPTSRPVWVALCELHDFGFEAEAAWLDDLGDAPTVEDVFLPGDGPEAPGG